MVKPALYTYEILVKRHDGLMWLIRRRYKEIRKLRDDLYDKYASVQ